ncbi:Ger(x)C family spore germination protein [Paenibacillus lactis]|uniref:Germination protein, Ger(X)C family n=1 Tax=Paenibacillus lactis 154 TaxID=743719 RepID=G4HJP5_9BACL|nr:Ger(x)C family spore germination protein [Paenibacillus lactis]EHB62499.1 germination protein, Ger(x)C family [Paenibacillus lactis 154]
MREHASVDYKLRIIMTLLLLASLLTGCWDRMELEERAVVLGISIDTAGPDAAKKEDEVSHLMGKYPAPKQSMIQLSVQIALPGRIPLGPGESGGSSDGGGKQTVWVLSVVGHTIDDAMMNLQQQISGKLFFGHLRVIVISEEIARKGIQNINDYLHRNAEVRRMAWMMVSKGKAKALMEAAPKLERVPTLYLASTLDDAVRHGKFPTNYIGTFWSNSSKKGQEGFLPYIQIMEGENVQISGIAYFKGERMVGTTKPFEIAGYLVIKGISPAGYRGIIHLGDDSQIVTIHATNREATTTVKIKDGVPHFTITAMTEVNVEEKNEEVIPINSSRILEEIASENERSVKELVLGLLRKTQEKESDIFGFGELVRATKPTYWNRNVRTADRWQKLYKESTFEIHVTSKVRRVGMKSE